ncbi:DUF6153 family protein [Brevibacterium linens]|uniref:DUF6153 family protein n=1 Tax=Brevibacterium linens TaxID=1703 RepID=UPI0011AF7E23|nr:DUF6153 family protein [Brevibacterium linens]
MKSATPEPCRSRHWLQLVVLTALLIVGLLGMHALVGGSAAATSMASSAHASSQSAGTTTSASVSSASGAQGSVHGSGGCADAMNGGDSTCVSAPTVESIPALPVPSVADVLTPVSAPLPTPPLETPRRFALTHLELSIHRT